MNTPRTGIEPVPLLAQRAPYTKGGHFGLTTTLVQHPLCQHVPKCEPHSLGQWQMWARSSRLVSMLGQDASNQRPVEVELFITYRQPSSIEVEVHARRIHPHPLKRRSVQACEGALGRRIQVRDNTLPPQP